MWCIGEGMGWHHRSLQEKGRMYWMGMWRERGACVTLSWEHLRQGGRFGFRLLLRPYFGGPRVLLQGQGLLWYAATIFTRKMP